MAGEIRRRDWSQTLRRRTSFDRVLLFAVGVCTAAAAGLGPSVLTEKLSTSGLVAGFIVSAAAWIALRLWLERREDRRGDVLVVALRTAGGVRRHFWRDDDFDRALACARRRFLNAHDLTVNLPSEVESWPRFVHRVAGAVHFVKSSSGQRGDLRGIVPLGSLTAWFATGVVLGGENEPESVIAFDRGGGDLVDEVDRQAEQGGDESALVSVMPGAASSDVVSLLFDFAEVSRATQARDRLQGAGVDPSVYSYGAGRSRHLDLGRGELEQICDEVSNALPSELRSCIRIEVIVAAPVYLAFNLGQVVAGALHDRATAPEIVLHEWQAGAGPARLGAYATWVLDF